MIFGYCYFYEQHVLAYNYSSQMRSTRGTAGLSVHMLHAARTCHCNFSNPEPLYPAYENTYVLLLRISYVYYTA